MRRFLPEPEPWTARWSLRLALAGVAVAGLGVAVARFGNQAQETGLAIAAGGLLLAIVALILAAAACVAIWRSGSTGLSLAVRAILVALALLAWPGYLLGRALTLPLVNDLTTDLEEPPSFSRSRAALMARGGYQPPEFVPSDTESGLAVYRDLQGMTLESSAGEAYLAALKAVASLGWRIVDQVPPGGRTGTGRIDAVATTTLFRFADDITIRVRPVAGETRVDIRSRSRVGRHDLGVNAGRIRAFLAELREQAAAR
jgi:hypothetical protein